MSHYHYQLLLYTADTQCRTLYSCVFMSVGSRFVYEPRLAAVDDTIKIWPKCGQLAHNCHIMSVKLWIQLKDEAKWLHACSGSCKCTFCDVSEEFKDGERREPDNL